MKCSCMYSFLQDTWQFLFWMPHQLLSLWGAAWDMMVQLWMTNHMWKWLLPILSYIPAFSCRSWGRTWELHRIANTMPQFNLGTCHTKVRNITVVLIPVKPSTFTIQQLAHMCHFQKDQTSEFIWKTSLVFPQSIQANIWTKIYNSHLIISLPPFISWFITNKTNITSLNQRKSSKK
jgi:hypothetical protein